MSQSLAPEFTSSSADGVPLFACTKCNSRHPFEDLSPGHQLCKECRSLHQVSKCNYCRSEYQPEVNGNGVSGGGGGGGGRGFSICKKCEQLQAQHGRPGPCAYCNIIAAFIGTKCQRCTNSENKYGPPMSCEHCKQKCAFDRNDPDSKKKVDNKLLCWLCTMAYKRTLARARQKEAMLKKQSSHIRTSGEDTQSYSTNRHSSSSSALNGHRHSSHTNNVSGSSSSPYHRSSSHRHSHSESSSNHNHSHNHQRESSMSKKARLDFKSSSKGHQSFSVPSLSDSRFVDPNNGNDLGAVVTQLKDQVAMLNKKLQIKEKEMLLKDQQIADLKSTNTREQRELREKINSIQKQHADRISELQAKLINLQKQLAAQTKAAKNMPAATPFIEPPLVI